MEINILAEFVRLVETGSFQETAEKMNIAQSTLTKHIHKLEEELNIPIFDRSQRSARINDYGQQFYPYAQQIVQLYSEGVAAVQEMNASEKSLLTVAYDPLLGQYGVVDILTDFAATFPQHTMNAIESYNTRELLANKKCSFAFVREADATDAIYSKIIFKTDHLAVVVPKNHPLAACSSVTLSQLVNEQFVLHSSSSTLPHDETRKFLELCASQNFTPKIVAESHFTSTMLHYVRNGMGIAVLNRMHIPFGVSDFAAIEFTPTVRTCLYMLYPQRVSSQSAKDFLHFMIDRCSG